MTENKPGSSEIWTKEAKRIDQITAIEDKINIYKEAGQWGLVLNALEDYLRFQVEAIEEKDPETKKKTQGIKTVTYQEQMGEILNLSEQWDNIQMRSKDPASRMNNRQEAQILVRKVKLMIDKIYHNNIVYNLTYRRAPDPMEAWKT